MKVIINNINIYHIHDNRYYNNGINSELNVGYGKMEDADLTEDFSQIIVNDDLNNDDSPLIAQLKERILQSEIEVKQLLDQMNSETK
ncbi:hypothetical protein [Mucilaginibacter jinjuensis]|uniref:Uncharacterized protein n=1 Tax=Mucilaginibacter jinjuensis TaxID=1176721 RepID=A0ABY7T7N3_9SPHI|nr:hypothetical protein [Mucilaginibacter jinjuensis]WCT12288.1 hypothetical protein PQO05_26550 [Mucilaginibacter jinjuensis]